MRGMLFAVAFLTSLAGSAQASTVTYGLSLTPQSGSSLSGSGTLTITDGPVNPSGLFNVPVADISTLSILIGGFNFNLLGNISALQFTNGALSDITAADAIGAASLQVNSTTSVYFDNLPSGGISSTDTISAVLQATPLPASLPLFAGGIGLVGYLAGRRKQKSAPQSR